MSLIKSTEDTNERKVLVFSDKPCLGCGDIVYIYIGWRKEIVCSACAMVLKLPYKKK